MAWVDLMRIAKRRFGVVSLMDAEACDLDHDTLIARARTEGWVRLHPGIYLVPGAADGPMARTIAAVLATDGYAARGSALWLHRVVDQAPLRPQLLVPYGRRGVTTRGVDMVRTRRLPTSHCTDVGGVPATTVARSILDLARNEHPRRLLSLVLEAERRKRFDRADLARARRDLGKGFGGLKIVDQVLADLGAMRSDSGWEHEVRLDLHRMGFPVHPEPFPWRCEDGVVVHLDVAFPEHWVYGECDGRGYHSATKVFDTDRVRWTQIARQWRPVWITFQRWRYQRGAVVADVRRALELAATGAAPARPAY